MSATAIPLPPDAVVPKVGPFSHAAYLVGNETFYEEDEAILMATANAFYDNAPFWITAYRVVYRDGVHEQNRHALDMTVGPHGDVTYGHTDEIVLRDVRCRCGRCGADMIVTMRKERDQ